MDTGIRKACLTAVLVLCLFWTLPLLGCGDDDDEEPASDEFNPNGGGGGGGDDDSVGDDDDSTDDDTGDDDDDDTDKRIAVVYGADSLNASFEAFLIANEFNYSFVDEQDLPIFDFAEFDAVVVLQNAGFYQNEQWTAISNSNLPVIGMYEGGAILFGKMGLFADLGSAASYTGYLIYANDPEASSWTTPNVVAMTEAGLVEMATISIFCYAHSMVAAPQDVYSIADLWGETDRGVISVQASKYLFWGFEFAPDYYTQAAYDLLANLIYAGLYGVEM